jgi:hypothetical protein
MRVAHVIVGDHQIALPNDVDRIAMGEAIHDRNLCAIRAERVIQRAQRCLHVADLVVGHGKVAIPIAVVGVDRRQTPLEGEIILIRRKRVRKSVVMGPDFARLSAHLGRNLVDGRLGILTAVFEAASTNH